MGVNTTYLINHLMDRYGKIIETDLQDNQKRFDEALDTTSRILVATDPQYTMVF